MDEENNTSAGYGGLTSGRSATEGGKKDREETEFAVSSSSCPSASTTSHSSRVLAGPCASMAARRLTCFSESFGVGLLLLLLLLLPDSPTGTRLLLLLLPAPAALLLLLLDSPTGTRLLLLDSPTGTRLLRLHWQGKTNKRRRWRCAHQVTACNETPEPNVPGWRCAHPLPACNEPSVPRWRCAHQLPACHEKSDE